MPLVEYAYYHEEFGSGVQDREDIDDIAETIFPDEYDDSIHYKKIFCPKCKVALKRTPRGKEKTANNKDAFFSHYKSKIECNWHTRTPTGINYLNEEDTWKSISNETLAVITQWSTVPEEELRQNGRPVYTGVNEDLCSDQATEIALGRYRNGEIPLPNRITSVRTIAYNIDRYKHKAIILPDSDQALEIQSLLKPLDAEEFKIDDRNHLFFGRVNNFKIGHHLDFLNIENESQSTSIWVPKKISKIRKFSDKTENRAVLVYGTLKHHQDTMCVKIQNLGQIAYIPKDKERYFWY